MMFAQVHRWRVITGRIRRLRRVLGWREAARLAFAERMGRRKITITLPSSSTSIELRLDASDGKVFEKIWLDQEYLPPFEINPEFIIDAGANVGLSALYFAHLFPQAQIVALEPEKENFRLLSQNSARHPRIHPQQAALWGRPTSLQIADAGAASWAFRVAEIPDGNPKGSEGVLAITIPQLLTQYGRDQIDLLKLDIEGAERELFTPDCREWLSKVRMIIIELHDRGQPGCSRAFYSELVRHPFSQEQRGENIFVLLTPNA